MKTVSKVQKLIVKENQDGTLTQNILVSMKDESNFTKSEVIKFNFLKTDSYDQQDVKANAAAAALVATYN